MPEPRPDETFYAISFDPATKGVRTFGRDALLSEVSDPTVFSWIDLEARDVSRFAALLTELGLDQAPCTGFTAPEILPRIEERPRYVSFHLYEIDDPERHLDTSRGLAPLTVTRCIVVLAKEFILTYHAEPICAVDEVRRGCEDAFRLAGKSPGFVSFLLLQRSLYEFADVNLANDNYLDALDPSIAKVTRAELAEDIGIAGRNIVLLKKLTTSLHIVLMLLATKRSAFITEEGRVSYRQMQDNALAVRSAVDSSRDILDGIVAGMQAESSQRTSDIATVLTIVSAIMLPLTLIAGLYGMNFEEIPGAKHPQGFWLLSVGMIVLAALMVWIFHRLGWIGQRKR